MKYKEPTTEAGRSIGHAWQFRLSSGQFLCKKQDVRTVLYRCFCMLSMLLNCYVTTRSDS
jgi:hypothetical protein